MCKTIIHDQTHHPAGDKNIYNACVDISYIARSLHILKTKWAQIPCQWNIFYVQINSSSNSPCQTLLKRSPFGSTLKILSHTLRKSKKKTFHSQFSRLQKFNWNLKPNWTQSQTILHTIKPFLHIFLTHIRQWCITTNSFTHLEHQVTWPKSHSKYLKILTVQLIM